MDSLKDQEEIDEIYERTEASIDLGDITTEEELSFAVKSKQAERGRGGGWASTINELIFGKVNKFREDKVSAFKSESSLKKAKVLLGKLADKTIEAVFNKRVKGSYLIGRDSKTGRFTKYTDKDLAKVLHQ